MLLHAARMRASDADIVTTGRDFPTFIQRLIRAFAASSLRRTSSPRLSVKSVTSDDQPRSCMTTRHAGARGSTRSRAPEGLADVVAGATGGP